MSRSTPCRWCIRQLISPSFILCFGVLYILYLSTKSFTKLNQISKDMTPHYESHSDQEENGSPIHWNSTEHLNPPTIYMCSEDKGNGYPEAKKLLKDVFPEYVIFNLGTLGVGGGRPPKKIPGVYLHENFTNTYDIFLDNFDFPKTCHVYWSGWLQTHFNGHILLFSPESPKMHPINHVLGNRGHMHAFGPLLQPQEHDLILTYLQFVYWHRFQDTFPTSSLADPNQRPKNNATDYMIYANSNCVKFREIAVGRLSKFGPIHCDGRCQGAVTDGNRTNLVKTKHGIGIGNWWQNIELYSQYKFCFVMEHEEDHVSYITEKIMMAFMAGCIPIYHGPPLIFDLFNKDAFVFYNITDPEKSLELVKALHENKEMYNTMMGAPILANGQETIEKYFSFNDTVGNGRLKRDIREKFGLKDGYFLP